MSQTYDQWLQHFRDLMKQGVLIPLDPQYANDPEYVRARTQAMGEQQTQQQQQQQQKQQQQGSSGTPSWATDANFYNVLNTGWKQGHGGQDIPQERYEYLQRRYNEEASSPTGAHVGDMGWWQNRAAIDGSGGGDGGSGSGTAGNGTLAQFSFTPYEAPAPINVGQFTAPTMDEALNDPGYAFTLKQGQDALEASAAAHGTLRTGGTLKDIVKYGQDAATTQYNNVYSRDLSSYQANASNALSQYNANVANAQNAWNMNNSGALNAFLANQGVLQQQTQNLQWQAQFGLSQSGIPQAPTPPTPTPTIPTSTPTDPRIPPHLPGQPFPGITVPTGTTQNQTPTSTSSHPDYNNPTLPNYLQYYSGGNA